MEGKIIMSRKEFQRMRVFREVAEKRMTLVVAAALIRTSYRQAKRLKARFAHADGKGLIHRNRGRTPANALNEDTRTRVIELHSQRYPDTNDTHFTELLREREGIDLGRETVRRILRGAGLPPKRRRRPPKHRSRRQRKERLGQMIQWDGSPHPWFGKRHPPCCLLAAVDDATTTLLAALFTPAESSEGYLRLLVGILEAHGIPMAIYHDQHSSLVRTDGHWSLQEQMQGRQFPTHVGRVLEELGIESIPATSPQAKGRIEKTFATLQDRLLPELRLANIADIPPANDWLKEHFIPRYNARFALSPVEGTSAFVPISKEKIHPRVAFAYEATVGNDNAVRLGGIVIDIPPGPARRSYAKANVLVRQHLDGSWTVSLESQQIAWHPPTPLREPVRSWKPRGKRDRGITRSDVQVYIASKPALPDMGTLSLGS
jgi:transposase